MTIDMKETISPYFLALRPVLIQIGETFGPDCEVVLHDFNHPKNSVVMVVNGEVTGRHVGQTFNDLMSIIQSPYLKNDCLNNYIKHSKDGKLLKCSTSLLRNQSGEVVGAICINYDLSRHMQIKKQMDDFCRGIDLEAKEESTDLLGEGVSDILRQILDRTISDAGIPVSAMSRQDKMEIVRFLDEKEVFSIKGSVEELAKQLAVSRYTIYNYLDEVRNRKE